MCHIAQRELKATTSAFVIQITASETMSYSSSHGRLYTSEELAADWDVDMLGNEARILELVDKTASTQVLFDHIELCSRKK